MTIFTNYADKRIDLCKELSGISIYLFAARSLHYVSVDINFSVNFLPSLPQMSALVCRRASFRDIIKF